MNREEAKDQAIKALRDLLDYTPTQNYTAFRNIKEFIYYLEGV